MNKNITLEENFIKSSFRPCDGCMQHVAFLPIKTIMGYVQREFCSIDCLLKWHGSSEETKWAPFLIDVKNLKFMLKMAKEEKKKND